MLAKRYHSLK